MSTSTTNVTDRGDGSFTVVDRLGGEWVAAPVGGGLFGGFNPGGARVPGVADGPLDDVVASLVGDESGFSGDPQVDLGAFCNDPDVRVVSGREVSATAGGVEWSVSRALSPRPSRERWFAGRSGSGLLPDGPFASVEDALTHVFGGVR